MFLAPFAKLIYDQAVGSKFFIFGGVVIDMMADGAFHRDTSVL